MTGESFNAALRAAREDERERVKRFVISYYSAAVAITLHDKWGFGNKRLTRLANQINYVFDSILLGYVDIEDILTAIAEETGVIL